MRFLTRLPVACAIAFTVGCTSQAPPPPQPPDTRAADEAAIRQADEEWASSAAQKSVDTWVSHYSDDAVVLPPNEAMANSKDAIRKSLINFLGMPGLSVTWRSTKVDVARSGDLGYSVGTYEITMNDPKGKPMTDRGKYVEVWKKQANGTWKCAVDTFNSDLPAAPAK